MIVNNCNSQKRFQCITGTIQLFKQPPAVNKKGCFKSRIRVPKTALKESLEAIAFPEEPLLLEFNPTQTKKLNVINPIPEAGFLLNILFGRAKSNLRVRDRKIIGLAFDCILSHGRRYRLFTDQAINSYEHRFELKQALIPILARNPPANYEDEKEAALPG